MQIPNLNYKKGAIRLAVVLTLIFAIYGWYSRNSSPTVWLYNGISDIDITELAIKESQKSPCNKASVISVTFDNKNHKSSSNEIQDTILVILNTDPSKPNVLGQDVAGECKHIAELTRHMQLPKSDDKYPQVADITKEMYQKAESLERRGIYWEYIQDRFIGVVEYVWMLWKSLAVVGIATLIGVWALKGFKPKT